ncbi:TetR/AcrR family transcriptional regulator [Nocardia sp. BMG51109]|uniref:TetR/AcrR family transcriptional regulator n=1 Tax=Nocardia sp. BMG51109 TaxID=1056816 RepID=UPI0004675C47|nr:TetR family transcriptional regulator [Nocardia sp. BMG51109]
MSRPQHPEPSLRERKQRRVRQAIVEAAHELFAERGYGAVTVTDIAARAEVGRATFFRYFGDKQEVVFGDGHPDWSGFAAAAPEPIGAGLPAALDVVRTLVVGFVSDLVARPDAYIAHERLVAGEPELRARSLAKQRHYVGQITALLVEAGAESETASLAAELGLACFYAGRTAADNDPHRLTDAVASAFDRLRSAVR